MAAATASRKRKQTEDMEVSPPKRVTRARTAKTQDAPAATTKSARVTKSRTAAEEADKSMSEAKSTRSAATAKRVTRTNYTEAIEGDGIEEEPASPEPPKTRGRPKKSTVTDTADTKMNEASKGRTRATKAASSKPTSSKTATSAATTRTRTRAATIEEGSEDELGGVEDEVSQSKSQEEVAPVTKRSARGRLAAKASSTTNVKITAPSTRAAASSRATGATAATAAKTAAPKKRVAFTEEAQDKENVPVRGRNTVKAKVEDKSTTGIRGKPVRKAAAATTKTRAAPSRTNTEKSAPLSPKKVNQVAKGNTSSSEDELGSNSPGRPIAKSPIRPPSSARKALPFADDAIPSPGKPSQDHLEPMLNKSPIKPLESARKNTAFATVPMSSPTKASHAGLVSSLLMTPAKRVPVISSNLAVSSVATSQPTTNPLASPAKRVHVDLPKLTGSQPELQASMKQSLLQSPPRRPKIPLGSATAIPKEKKPLITFEGSADDDANARTFNFSAGTPRRLFASEPISENDAATAGSAEHIAEDDEAEMEIMEHDHDVPDVVEPSSDRVEELDFDDTIIMSPASVNEEGNGTLKDNGAEEMDAAGNAISTTPAGSPSVAASGRLDTVDVNRTLFRDNKVESSEDDLSASGSFRSSNNSIATPTPGLRVHDRPATVSERGSARKNETKGLEITPLARQFSNWLAADQTESEQDTSAKCSPSKVSETKLPGTNESPDKPTYFDEEMLVRQSAEAMDIAETNSGAVMDDTLAFSQSNDVTVSNFGGDDTVQVDPQLLDAAAAFNVEFTMPMDVDIATTTADPLELNMTPAQAMRPVPREVMTVSKVPLKPSDDASPSKVHRTRMRSLAPAVESNQTNEPSLSPGPANVGLSTPPRAGGGRVSSNGSPAVDDTLLRMATPFRTPRFGADAQILRGAVIFVDVHTGEGAEASGIFADLLTQMGARCVKQWSWNPRSSSVGAKGELLTNGRVGITHVVFKDGSKRTLEKVREARGLVSCVGVGWVLDCERENKWLDETEYSVDTSSIPRGGNNRRKSMEPRALANVNGTLKPASGSPGRSLSTPNFNMSPTKEFLTFSNPGSPSDGEAPTFDAATPTINFGAGIVPLPETPAVLKESSWDFTDGNDDLGKTPTTPYLMNRGAELVQATCPPKQQTGRMLFPASGRIEDEPDEDIRRRLMLARRKSLQWAPKIGSPLRRG